MGIYFRATIDFTIVDDDAPIIEELRAAAGIDTNDEILGRALMQNIEAGVIEIDAISNIEDLS
jgi:hypothetical protein